MSLNETGLVSNYIVPVETHYELLACPLSAFPVGITGLHSLSGTELLLICLLGLTLS